MNAIAKSDTAASASPVGPPVVLVTGAGGTRPGRGMGRAIVDAFASDGAHIVAVDKDGEAANDVAAAVRAKGGLALGLQADVTREMDVQGMAEAAQREFGRIDVLINHAGYADMNPMLETSTDVWDDILAVNLTGPYLVTRHLLPGMIERGGGVVVNTISVAGLAGGRSGFSYTVSKHGLAGLTKHVAASYGHLGIRCVGVCPGIVRDEAALAQEGERVITEGPDYTRLQRWPSLPKIHAANPRVGLPNEVASVIVFLASHGASFINGALLPVDAGWTAM